MALILIIGNKNYSSWSLRPWLVLKQSGLEFEEVRIPLDLPDTTEQISAYSPSGRVPALQHDGLTLWESLAICEYIAELAPDRHLWPAEAAARAVARAVSAEMHSGFSSLRSQMPVDCRARRPQTATPAVQRDIDRICNLWQTCRQNFGGTGDFLFSSFSIADAMYAPVATRFVTYAVPLPPIAQAYVDALWQLPAMQEWLAAAAAETEVIDTDQDAFRDRNSD
ncbi:glutathione S-transferase family protein [Microcoleus sp. FACHB-1515]|uniref:glutathione S-transferase family protein n=1 Tax=Cyanophyceae TaxID=3028117 RepID=UPI001683DF47|nr:glutathione S-transferase family protein [Microcoleus sp. FACHB-1515]MBD2090876.1 glutathione S-transferase family protein [Microcoleus sp. FACHB-1515]